MKDKFIVSAALTGAIHTPTMSPHLPITPDELAEDARRAYEAGAAVVHVHARNPETGQPSADSDLYGEILAGTTRACSAMGCLGDLLLIPASIGWICCPLGLAYMDGSTSLCIPTAAATLSLVVWGQKVIKTNW